MEVSRWCKPPVTDTKMPRALKGRRHGAARLSTAPAGARIWYLQRSGGLHHRLISNVPSARVAAFPVLRLKILVPSRYLHGGLAVVIFLMRTLFSPCVASIIATGLFLDAAFAGRPVDQASEQNKQVSEQAVFVTGSLIPQRIKRKSIGTTTVSPIRVIDRREIDATGRRTTQGVLIADPSVRLIGH